MPPEFSNPYPLQHVHGLHLAIAQGAPFPASLVPLAIASASYGAENGHPKRLPLRLNGAYKVVVRHNAHPAATFIISRWQPGSAQAEPPITIHTTLRPFTPGRTGP